MSSSASSAPPCAAASCEPSAHPFPPPTFVPGWHDEASVRRMRYVRLGADATGAARVVSALSYGASALGGVFGGGAGEARELVHAAVRSGINLLDVAPWYGHGAAEAALGDALQGVPRAAYYLTTKVARYNPAPLEMFDFSYGRTLRSVQESMARLRVEYIDTVQVRDEGDEAGRRGRATRQGAEGAHCARERAEGAEGAEGVHCARFARPLRARFARPLRALRASTARVHRAQVHDPEFAPSLDVVIRETLPALAEAVRRGWVRAIGITGYPLDMLEALAAGAAAAGVPVLSALSYSHYCLHDTSLVDGGTLARLAAAGVSVINGEGAAALWRRCSDARAPPLPPPRAASRRLPAVHVPPHLLWRARVAPGERGAARARGGGGGLLRGGGRVV